MTTEADHHPSIEGQLEDFERRATGALDDLFNAARGVDEFQFALALMVEMRGMQDAGWNTAADANLALEQYVELLEELGPKRPIAVRVGLSLYAHLSEAAGLYEVPKNMLRIATGGFHSLWPFSDLVEKHKVTGETLAPNSNRIMKDLLGHAVEAGLQPLADVILEAFDADIRHGYAHADYVVWNDGVRLRRRNGGAPRIVGYDEFYLKLNKAITFFRVLQGAVSDTQRSFSPPVLIYGRMNSQDPPMYAIVDCDLERKGFRIRTAIDYGPEHPEAVKAAEERRKMGLPRWISDGDLDALIAKTASE